MDVTMLLPLVLIALLLLMMSRQRKAGAQQTRMRAGLTPGQRVMTTSGIFATVVDVVDDRVQLEIAPGTVIEVLAVAIGRLEPSADAVAADPGVAGATPPVQNVPVAADIAPDAPIHDGSTARGAATTGTSLTKDPTARPTTD